MCGNGFSSGLHLYRKHQNVADATNLPEVVKGQFSGSPRAVPRSASAKTRPPRATAPAAARRCTREEHSQEPAQDYVELIAVLVAETGEARAIDLARRLGVTHVTVGRTI